MADSPLEKLTEFNVAVGDKIVDLATSSPVSTVTQSLARGYGSSSAEGLEQVGEADRRWRKERDRIQKLKVDNETKSRLLSMARKDAFQEVEDEENALKAAKNAEKFKKATSAFLERANKISKLDIPEERKQILIGGAAKDVARTYGQNPREVYNTLNPVVEDLNPTMVMPVQKQQPPPPSGPGTSDFGLAGIQARARRQENRMRGMADKLTGEKSPFSEAAKGQRTTLEDLAEETKRQQELTNKLSGRDQDLLEELFPGSFDAENLPLNTLADVARAKEELARQELEKQEAIEERRAMLMKEKETELLTLLQDVKEQTVEPSDFWSRKSGLAAVVQRASSPKDEIAKLENKYSRIREETIRNENLSVEEVKNKLSFLDKAFQKEKMSLVEKETSAGGQGFATGLSILGKLGTLIGSVLLEYGQATRKGGRAGLGITTLLSFLDRDIEAMKEEAAQKEGLYKTQKNVITELRKVFESEDAVTKALKASKLQVIDAALNRIQQGVTSKERLANIAKMRQDIEAEIAKTTQEAMVAENTAILDALKVQADTAYKRALTAKELNSQGDFRVPGMEITGEKRPSKDDIKKLTQTRISTKQVVDLTDDMLNMLGPEGTFDVTSYLPGIIESEDVKKVQAALRELQLRYKEVYNLGVLSGPDLNLLESITGSRPQGLRAGTFYNNLKKLRDRTVRDFSTAGRQYGYKELEMKPLSSERPSTAR